MSGASKNRFCRIKMGTNGLCNFGVTWFFVSFCFFLYNTIFWRFFFTNFLIKFLTLWYWKESSFTRDRSCKCRNHFPSGCRFQSLVSSKYGWFCHWVEDRNSDCTNEDYFSSPCLIAAWLCHLKHRIVKIAVVCIYFGLSN